MFTLVANQDTWLKQKESQAAELADTDKFFVKTGTKYRAKAIKQSGHHFPCTFDQQLGQYNTWFLWPSHWKITQDNYSPAVESSSYSVYNTQDKVFIPGLGERTLMDRIDGVTHFTWAEATRNGQRIWKKPETTKRVQTIGHYLDTVRLTFDSPIIVTSWYRDPITNKRVGGASQSRHLQGDAVDFIVTGVSPEEVFKRLRKTYQAGGLAFKAGSFTHMDARGFPVSWQYN